MPEPTAPRPDVPDELMDLACARFTDRPVEPGTEWIPMRRALAAVVPVIKRQVREQAADELEERIQAMREEGEHDMRTVLRPVRDVLRGEP